MIILTNKKQKQLIEAIRTNQIIINDYNNLDLLNQISFFDIFCKNTKEMLLMIGGVKEVDRANKEIFFWENKRP